MTTTWRNLRSQLSADLSADAVELVRRATAPARHESRVLAAAEAALDATADAVFSGDDAAADRLSRMRAICLCRVAGGPDARPTFFRSEDLDDALAWGRRAATLIHIELNGTGGHMDAGGGSRATARMSWARALGKGRHQASDGAAWDAALADAARRLGDYGTPNPTGVANLVTGYVLAEDIPWVRSYCRQQILSLAREQPEGWAEQVAEWDRAMPAMPEAAASAA